MLLLPLLGEAALRVTGHHFSFPLPCHWVDGTGCLLDANTRSTFAVGESSFALTTNGDGRRERSRSPRKQGTRRVVVLGDSGACGARVNDDEPFPAQLDARLSPSGIEVFNAASFYLKGTDQQLSYLVDYGAAMSPNVVLVAFSAKNDFSDNARQEFWKAGNQGLSRMYGPPPVARWRQVLATNNWAVTRWLDAHSWLFGAFRFYAWNILDRAPIDTLEPQQTEAVLERMKLEAAQLGARMAIITLPGEETKRQMLQRIADRLSVPMLDPTPLLAAPGLQFEDGHLTPKGHAIVAQALADKLPTWMEGTVAP